MELKLTTTNEQGESQVLLLTKKNEVKHGITSAKSSIMHQPWVKQYKNRGSAFNKFKQIAEAIINESH